MYQECCEGGLCVKWQLPEKKRMGFRKYRLRLSEQMLTYSPKFNVYPGDENFREWTRRPKRVREPIKIDKALINGQMLRAFKIARLETRLIKPRMCGDLGAFEKHAQSMTKTTHKAACEICGKDTRYLCGLCNKRLCCYSGKNWSVKCIAAYHSDNWFGLARSDAPLHGRLVKHWKRPTTAEKNANARIVAELKRACEDSDDE